MKKIYLLILFVTAVICASAQSIEVKSFTYLQYDLTTISQEGRRIDQNGDVAALIKIVTVEKDFSFEGGTLGIVDTQQRKGEIWVWVPRGLRKISILHERFGVLRDYRFPEDIEAERTYEMVLITTPKEDSFTKDNKEKGNQALLVFNVSPKEALLEVNDQVWSIDTKGAAVQQVNYGEYNYRASAAGYLIEAGTIIVDGSSLLNEVTIALQPDLDGVSSQKCIFSLGFGRKVYFSKGNLQYQPSTNTWRFAENPWDIIGENNENISSTYEGWIDLFGWGTKEEPTKTVKDNKEYPNCTRWDKLYGEGWEVLDGYDLGYILYERKTTSGIRYAKGTVSGVHGLILLPDDWSSSVYELNDVNRDGAHYKSNIISAETWNKILLPSGAVFLPAAGYREGTTVYRIDSWGCYWSDSSSDEKNASGPYFSNGGIYQLNFGPRYVGRSVRLMRRVK